MLGFTKILPIVASLVFIGSKITSRYTDNIFHNLKISIPAEMIKVGFNGFTSFFIKASLKVQNHFYMAVDLKDVHMTIFYKKNDSTLAELGSTPPSSENWVIKSNSTSIIKDIQLNITSLSVLPAIKSLLKQPEGQRFKILISGYANSLPFTQEIWY